MSIYRFQFHSISIGIDKDIKFSEISELLIILFILFIKTPQNDRESELQ
jgi:hypothetical protein